MTCTQTLDRQGTPAQSASKISLAKVPATCVQYVRIGYVQDVLVFETLQIIVKPMAGGGLLFFINNSVSFTRKSLSTTSKNDPHLEELTISIAIDNTELLITNVYIPLASSCNGRYSPPIDYFLTGTDSLVLGDFNAYHSLWHSGTTDSRGN